MKDNVTEQPDHAARRHRPGRLLRKALAVLQWAVGLLLLGAALFTFTPAGDWLAEKLTDVDPPARADYILVLGGSTDRVVAAAGLYRQGWAKKVILSTTGKNIRRYAELAERYGIASKALILDDAPSRTSDHPRTVAALKGVDPSVARFLIVTSPFHTLRARAVFARAGYRHVRMSAPDWLLDEDWRPRAGTWLGRARDLPLKVYEVIGLAYYKLRGWS